MGSYYMSNFRDIKVKYVLKLTFNRANFDSLTKMITRYQLVFI